MPVHRLLGCLVAVLASLPATRAGSPPSADEQLSAYFRSETARLATNAFAGIQTLHQWEARRVELRRELLEMLGLWPLPGRTDLKATVTGEIESDDIVVERLHFQSLPGLYVTANLYRPRRAAGRLPAILYVCGHAAVRTNNLSCGNKTAYQHHGIWFAQHGYVCLITDTLQLGEIEGLHHGTSRLGQWWWNSRGYTPAGVEAWNCIRALDYLESRQEVDPTRIGMSGRSGGGSYTWTTAAIDERVRVAAPVAGITDLVNHVVDGTVEGHCDCMFFVNTHRWEFGLNAALVAPRPLLMVNTDADTIFPLDGVQRVHAQVRHVYELYGATTNLGLVIAPGPHKDTQDLQVPVFRWFNRHLKGDDPLIAVAAVKRFEPLALRVFDALPADQRNTSVQEWFGPSAASASLSQAAPESTLAVFPDPVAPVLPHRPGIEPTKERRRHHDRFMEALHERMFGGWPVDIRPAAPLLVSDERQGRLRVRTWEFESQPNVVLRLLLISQGRSPRSQVTLQILDGAGWEAWKSKSHSAEAWVRMAGLELGPGRAVALLVPRGLGPNAWAGDDKKQVQIRRRFMLLGQTLDGMRVWDIRRGIRALAAVGTEPRGVALSAEGVMAVHAVYAALEEPEVVSVRLRNVPESLMRGPDYLNALQVMDIAGALECLRRRGTEVLSW